MTTVLIADDDDDIRASVRFALEDEGYRVIEARDGQAALNILRHTEEVVIALIDLAMPRLDGEGVFTIIARKSFHRLGHQHAYILFTAHTPKTYAALTPVLRQLHVSTLAKPFEIENLLKTVNNAAQRIKKP